MGTLKLGYKLKNIIDKQIVLSSCWLLLAVVMLGSIGAVAADLGQAHDWQMGFQAPATSIMERVINLHQIVFYVIAGICIFVLLLLGYVVFRFNEKANPTPAKWTHNHLLEAIWIIVPFIIVLVILIPNIKLMYLMDKNDKPDTTIKVIGNQWFWTYEYPVHKLEFESRMIPLDKVSKKAGHVRLLSVDNPLVVPAGPRLRLLVTSNDVLHAATIPSWGFKVDAGSWAI